MTELLAVMACVACMVLSKEFVQARRSSPSVPKLYEAVKLRIKDLII